MGYIYIKKVKEILNCSTMTINRLVESGKLHPVKENDDQRTHRLFDEKEVYAISPKDKDNEKLIYAYIRESKNSSYGAIQQQRISIQNWSKENNIKIEKIFSEFDSSLNFNREKLNFIVEEILKRHVKSIVVINKKILYRYGIELFEKICFMTGTDLIEIDPKWKDKEYSEDFERMKYDYDKFRFKEIENGNS